MFSLLMCMRLKFILFWFYKQMGAGSLETEWGNEQYIQFCFALNFGSPLSCFIQYLG